MACHGAFAPVQMWHCSLICGSSSRLPARTKIIPGRCSVRENTWQPQVLQKLRYFPGEDGKGTRWVSPETSLNPFSSVTRTEAKAEPENFRQSGQWLS